MNQILGDFPLNKVSSVQWSSGLQTGKLIIFASGNKADIQNVQKKDGKDIADLVRARIGTHQTAEAPGATPMAFGSIADELKKLGELRDTGVLSEEEFAAQKARLLG